MLIKLALPQTAWLSIYFYIGKSVVLHLREGPELRMHFDWMEKRKKAQHPLRLEPTTRVLLHRHVLYRCATTSALSELADTKNL